jgi:hypothetical protein|tara:strand:+ start:92 stop:622 length:531 start_codon:yes stop_codon:yes gene_type:complete
MILYTLLFFLIAFTIYRLNNPKSPLKSVLYSEKGKNITISYSSPSKKGRLIFGTKSESALVQFDKYWRTGANRRTIIKTATDLTFGDNVLVKGEYAMYTKPGLNKWDITFNSTKSYLGSFKPKPEMDLFTVSASPKIIKTPIEELSLDFIPQNKSDLKSNAIRLRWDSTEVVIPFD